MQAYCHACGGELNLFTAVGRDDRCDHCNADLHCCKNCEHWDPSAHNQCKEHIAEYIPDREKANFCSFFTFKDGAPEDTTARVAKSKAALDALFKKK